LVGCLNWPPGSYGARDLAASRAHGHAQIVERLEVQPELGAGQTGRLGWFSHWPKRCWRHHRDAMRLLLPIVLAVLSFGCRTNESPEDQVNDLEITTQLKSKLASDIGVSSVTNISVNSTNGVVTLSGQVDSEAAKSKAVALAKAVPKVVRVVNNLQIVTRKVAIACCGQSSSFS
jgi:hypothetical protein